MSPSGDTSSFLFPLPAPALAGVFSFAWPKENQKSQPRAPALGRMLSVVTTDEHDRYR
jgi:hypothetical protein